MALVPTNATFVIMGSTPLGTILATPLKHWILEVRVPVLVIPD